MLKYITAFLGIDIEELIDDILNNSYSISEEHWDRMKKIKSKKRKRKGIK